MTEMMYDFFTKERIEDEEKSCQEVPGRDQS